MKRLMRLLQGQLAARRDLSQRCLQTQFLIEVMGRSRRKVSNQGTDEFVETEGCESPFRADQPDRESLNHPNGDFGTFDAHGFQGLPVEFEEFRAADGDGARSSSLAENDAHLPKEIAGSELCHDAGRHDASRLSAARDLNLTALNHIEIDSGVSFVEDDLAFIEDPLERLVDLELRSFAGAQNCSPRPPEPLESAGSADSSREPALWRFRLLASLS